ncbi:hypothetical protein O181_092092 [Austropuccinia psidii MF-1]|uniref:Uncharacterized protein n=1 Tax=Austropuccinia psidii MF-1 TaxID=1389203 RepID=A0A9Q3IYT4_9BASI|nr:hypothetical protein [Austropuccinia psidii MF-1]
MRKPLWGRKELPFGNEYPDTEASTPDESIVNRISNIVYLPTNRYSYVSQEDKVINSYYGSPQLPSPVQPPSRKNKNILVTHSYQFTQPRPSLVPNFAPRPSSIPSTNTPPNKDSLTKPSPMPTTTNIQRMTATSSNTRAEGCSLPFPAFKVVQSRGL